jgi:hypothetical protein
MLPGFCITGSPTGDGARLQIGIGRATRPLAPSASCASRADQVGQACKERERRRHWRRNTYCRRNSSHNGFENHYSQIAVLPL